MGRVIIMATLWASTVGATIAPDAILALVNVELQRPYVIAMGASWCPGCEENKPVLHELANRGVPVVYIHYDEEGNCAKSCAEWFDIGDPKGAILQQTGLKMMPTTVIVPATGSSWNMIGLIPPGALDPLEPSRVVE